MNLIQIRKESQNNIILRSWINIKIHKNKKRKDDVTRETCYQIIVSQNKKFGIYYQIIRKNYILELKKKKIEERYESQTQIYEPKYKFQILPDQSSPRQFRSIIIPPPSLTDVQYLLTNVHGRTHARRI